MVDLWAGECVQSAAEEVPIQGEMKGILSLLYCFRKLRMQ
jgi:hypothetical protein